MFGQCVTANDGQNNRMTKHNPMRKKTALITATFITAAVNETYYHYRRLHFTLKN